MQVIFAGGWRGRWEGWLKTLGQGQVQGFRYASVQTCKRTRGQDGRVEGDWEEFSPSLPMRMATAVRDGIWLMVRLRNALRPLPTVRLTVPVISVGNITAGGTGKTPLTQWLCHRLRESDQRPALLTPLTAWQDETQEHVRFGISVYAGRDRVTNAKRAINDGATVIVLDDGFQYRRLHRDLDIVLWDATAWLHPANPLLREPLTGLQRADAIVLSKADALDEGQQRILCECLSEWAAGGKVVAAFGYEPSKVQAWREGQTEAVTGKRVVLATGIGNPFYFALTAKRAGYEVRALVCFPDHHRFTPADAALVTEIARHQRAEGVLTTRKDAWKWQAVWQDEFPLLILSVRLKWLWGEEALWQRVSAALSRHALQASEA